MLIFVSDAVPLAVRAARSTCTENAVLERRRSKVRGRVPVIPWVRLEMLKPRLLGIFLVAAALMSTGAEFAVGSTRARERCFRAAGVEEPNHRGSRTQQTLSARDSNPRQRRRREIRIQHEQLWVGASGNPHRNH